MSADTVFNSEPLEGEYATLTLPEPGVDTLTTAGISRNGEAASRSELKFSISDDMARAIREAVSLLMDPDPHASPTTGLYEVHTIYLDSPDMAIYRKSLNREADRFKLRIRFYNDAPGSPVFFEIKQSSAGCGIKKRFPVNRDTANALFAANHPWNSTSSLGPDEFSQIVHRFNARPIIHIAYVREAFVSRKDPSTRLTLDRQIRCQPAPRSLTTTMHHPIQIWQGKVILELKFADKIPPYLNHLIRSFGLETAKASKYMEGIGSRFGKGTEPSAKLHDRTRQPRRTSKSRYSM